MEQTTHIPPPRPLHVRLADLLPGHSAFLSERPASVRTALYKLRDTGRTFKTALEGEGLRVWRLT